MNLNLEKKRIRVGLMPLADAAPFVVARELGYYSRHGLEVELSYERTWAGVRDKLAAGVLDAAHMLAPMPLAATLGVDGVGVPMLTALSLNLNGNSIVVTEPLAWRMNVDGSDPAASGAALRRVLDEDRRAGLPLRILAHVFPFSGHHYELRYWLAACGIDPDRDVQLTVVPPSQMVSGMIDGRIDGFCVGAPWGMVAEDAGVGRCVVQKHQIWNFSPEKVLGVTCAWAQAHPQTHLALVAALVEACRWMDPADRREAAAQMLIDADLLDATPQSIQRALSRGGELSARGPGLIFHDMAANFPWLSHGSWLVQQMQRWGQVDATVDVDSLVRAVYRPDLFRQVAARLQLPVPDADEKSEGTHDRQWRMPGSALTLAPDLFFDGPPKPAPRR